MSTRAWLPLALLTVSCLNPHGEDPSNAPAGAGSVAAPPLPSQPTIVPTLSPGVQVTPTPPAGVPPAPAGPVDSMPPPAATTPVAEGAGGGAPGPGPAPIPTGPVPTEVEAGDAGTDAGAEGHDTILPGDGSAEDTLPAEEGDAG